MVDLFLSERYMEVDGEYQPDSMTGFAKSRIILAMDMKVINSEVSLLHTHNLSHTCLKHSSMHLRKGEVRIHPR